MAGFMSKVLEYIGIEETDEEEELYGEEEIFDEPRENGAINAGNRARRATDGKVVSLPSAAQLKMIVYHPISYEDTQNIIDNLKSRKPVIVNMEELELDAAQRILDFMAGAIYALNGTICKISRGIFVVAPTNYDVIGNGETDNDGLI